MLSWKACSISAKVRASSSEERSNLISAPQASPLLITDGFILYSSSRAANRRPIPWPESYAPTRECTIYTRWLLPGQTEAVIWPEAEEYLLPRDEVLVMVDLGADLVTPDLHATFKEIAEIDGINDFSREQIVVARAVRLARMNQDVLGSHT